MMNRTLAFAAVVVLSMVVGCGSSRQPRPKSMGALPPPPVAPAVPPARGEPIDQELREAAKREIRTASLANDPQLRANAIEAAQLALPDEAHPIVAKGLTDPAPLPRFAAAMAAGTLRYPDLRQQITELLQEPNRKVHMSVLYALHRLGDTTHSHELEKLARDPNPRIRQDVAFILGRLEEASARKILLQMLVDTDTDVRFEVASSLWLMRDERGLELLVAGIVSKFADDQMTCLMAIVGPKDRRVENYVRGKLTDPYLEVSLVAARSMGELGYDEGYTIAMNNIRSADPRQRLLSAMALGSIGRSDAQSALGALLRDGESRVRLGAAMALLQLKPPALAEAR